MTVTAIVLAAGASTRLGQPKQLLPLGNSTLLERTLDMVRASGLDEIVVALGAAADQVRSSVDLSDTVVVENRDFGTGCSSSIVTALDAVDDAVAGVVLFLGDQPFVAVEAVEALVDAGRDADIGVCVYDDGRGHPLWFARSMLPELRRMHGDKAVWKLLSSASFLVTEVRVRGSIPRDVDTWDDYEVLRAEAAVR
jgi:molybdenum cofactor cytidylyltransferase